MLTARRPSNPEVVRQKVLVVAPYFVPAFRGGGPIQTLKALIDAAPNSFDVSVVCANNDLGEKTSLVGTPNRWLQVDRANVRYVEGGVRALISAYRSASGANLVYLNSLFNPRFSMIPVLIKAIGLWHGASFLIAPRGELDPGALALKPIKKSVFLAAYKVLGLSRRLTWHASTPEEADQITRIFGPHTRILVRENETRLPARASTRPPRAAGPARLLFASRLVEKKGLLTLLEALAGVSHPVKVSVVGAFETAQYEARCRAVVDELPANIDLTFLGALPRKQVLAQMRCSDVMAFPTMGENFGHVVAEALSESCPVFASGHTPWSARLRSGGGAVVSDDVEAWRQALAGFVSQTPGEWMVASVKAGRSYERWRNEDKGPHIFELVQSATV